MGAARSRDVPTWAWFLIGWVIVSIVVGPFLWSQIPFYDRDFDDDWP